MSDVRPPNDMVPDCHLSAFLQRTVPPHRSGCVAYGAARDSRRDGRKGRFTGGRESFGTPWRELFQGKLISGGT